MVREMVDKVKAAEKKADEIIRAAKENSTERIKQAYKEAEEIKKEAADRGIKDKNEILYEKSRELEHKEGKMQEAVKKEAEEIKRNAALSEDKMIETVMENIYLRR